MKEVKSYLKNVIKNNDAVVLGCSGGPDSMCLLQLLISLQEKCSFQMICAHVNHKIRKESDEEYEFVKEYCEKNNVIFEGMEITDYKEDDNFHNAARMKRYDFYDECIQKYHANILMTAHHGDDLMETILMRIVRGSTLKGYAGFSMEEQKEGYKLLRPLIFTTKAEIETYNHANNIPYVTDASNLEDHYTRNRYRHHVLPFLKSEEKNVHQKFLQFSNELAKCNTFIEEYIKQEIGGVYQNNQLDTKKFLEKNEFIQTKMIEWVLHHLYEEDLFLITRSHVELLRNLVSSSKAHASVYLPNNIIAQKSYHIISFEREILKKGEYQILLEDFVTLPNRHMIKIIEEDNDHSNACIKLDTKEIALPLYVRTKQDGDKMEVKNLHGTKKVKDIFINSKIPQKLREEWPILVDSEGKVLWIPGVKKSKFDKEKNEKYDIILKYI